MGCHRVLPRDQGKSQALDVQSLDGTFFQDGDNCHRMLVFVCVMEITQMIDLQLVLCNQLLAVGYQIYCLSFGWIYSAASYCSSKEIQGNLLAPYEMNFPYFHNLSSASRVELDCFLLYVFLSVISDRIFQSVVLYIVHLSRFFFFEKPGGERYRRKV